MRKPKCTKFSFAPAENGFQAEINVEIDVCLSLVTVKAPVPTSASSDLQAPSMDLPTGVLGSGILESEAGVPPLSMSTGFLVNSTVKPDPPGLKGIWKDRSIFNVRPPTASPTSDVSRRYSAPLLSEDEEKDGSSESTYRGPNLKGAWASSGLTGASIVSTGTRRSTTSVLPVEEVISPTHATSCCSSQCPHCLCPHHVPVHGKLGHVLQTPPWRVSRQASGGQSGESSMTSSYGSYSSQDSWSRCVCVCMRVCVFMFAYTRCVH